MIRPRTLPVAFATLVAACVDPATGPDRVDLDLARFSPPPAYEVWFEELETCTGETGDFSRFRFFEVRAPLEGSLFPCDSRSGTCIGEWKLPYDILLAPQLLDFEGLVKHEMLHALLQVRGHPDVFNRCSPGFAGSGFDR